MIVTEKYKDLIERKKKIALREEQGWGLLHDHFDPDWKRGDEPYGTLIFTDEEPEVATPTRNLIQELDDLKSRVEKLEAKKPTS